MNRTMKAVCLGAGAAAVIGWLFVRSAEGHVDSPDFSVRTLKGEYVFALDGSTIASAGAQPRPFAWAGKETYDGAGHVKGVFTASYDGVILHRSYTGTYSVNPDGSGSTLLTDDHGDVTHFEIFVSKDGDEVSYVETDAGVVSSGYERRHRR